MVYAGLTASGYKLASLREEDPMAAVAARAASIPWPKDLIAYFRLARAVSTRLGIHERRLPEMIVVPNPLQAPQIADAVGVGERVFLIMAEPESESVVHEMLHHLLVPGLRAAEASIDRAYVLWKPVRDDMIRIGYAWDDSVESWRRVFEENLVRAATIWVGLQSEPGAGTDGSGRRRGSQKARAMAREQAGFGFLYVPVLLDMLLASWRGMENTDTFICDCLNACMVLCQE